MHTMTDRKGKSGTIDVKALLTGDEEFLRALVRTALQEVPEVEMTQALEAQKSERTAVRLGYRSDYYGRTLVTRIGKLELRVRRTARARSRPNCSSATNARSGRWLPRWRRCICKGFRAARACPRSR
jgi:transposase-like protein